jgi:exosortase K
MMTREPISIKHLVLQNGIFYMVVLLIAFGLKYHYSQARSDDLVWILDPTAGLVEHISGISCEKEVHTGYVNHEHRIIIAPSCAGVNFFIIAFCLVLFSFIHHLPRKRVKLFWLAIGMVSAYVLTILVNALRIISSIYFYNADIYCGWITPQRVHRLEGIVIYFFFLCLYYMIINKGIHHYCRRTAAKRKSANRSNLTQSDYLRWACAGLIPLFWYGLITLGIPLVNAAYRGRRIRFAEHSGMVISGCLVVIAAIFFLQMGWQRIGNTIKRLTKKYIRYTTRVLYKSRFMLF